MSGNHGERLVLDEDWEANNAETKARCAARRAILEENILESLRRAGEPQYSTQVADAMDMGVPRIAQILRDMEKAGSLTSAMVPMVNRSGPGRRYFQPAGA